MRMYNDTDLAEIRARDSTKEQIELQMERLQRGFLPLNILRPATIGDGIKILTDTEKSAYEELFAAKNELTLARFVPASGAASRMLAGIEKRIIAGKADQETDKTISEIDNFAFADKIERANGEEKLLSAISNYAANRPKGLIHFHSYCDSARTAVEEQLIEAAMTVPEGERVRVHFTISPEHRNSFREELRDVLPRLERGRLSLFHVDCSFQDSSTDTVALTDHGEPARDEQGKIIFRPAGHGALLSNLEATDTDLVFIKNIDNIAPDHIKERTTAFYRQLCGMTIAIREQIFTFYRTLSAPEVSADLISEAADFLRDSLCTVLPEIFEQMPAKEQAEFLKLKFTRPLRICAMVPNQGEPGGGPFWVAGADGTVSLQIVEQAQMNEAQKMLLKQSTHFNPVYMICSITNADGGKYKLGEFCNHEAGIVTEKIVGGIKARILELPGLWNGSMSDWNTVFVEGPADIFTPVKELNDLLREEHQPHVKETN